MRILSILLFIQSSFAFGAPLFNSTELLEVNLAYDITRLQKEKENLREDGLLGKLVVTETKEAFPVEILSRGRGSFACQQPQIKIRFDKDNNDGKLFEGLKKVKLFTRGACLENVTSDHQDKMVLSNYLIYKLYEMFSPHHFKTRLLKINYTDTSGKIAPYSQYGFFLEPKKNLGKRYKATYVENFVEIQQGLAKRYDDDLVSRINIFEFLISNLDYGIPGFYAHIYGDDQNYVGLLEKNMKVYEIASGELLPFIYDFDFSRFQYRGNFCSTNYRFFWDSSDSTCSKESILKNLKLDFDKFHYKQDVMNYKDEFLKTYDSWIEEFEDIFDSFGDEFVRGLILFRESLVDLK